MGCDIHDLVQVKRDGKWKTVVLDPCGSPRNYSTFAMLADVRNAGNIVPIAAPRGIPDDLGHAVVADQIDPGDGVDRREAYLGDDGLFWLGDHSYSWLLLSEMKAYKQPNLKFNYMPRLITELEKIANENEARDDELRYVFGFDN